LQFLHYAACAGGLNPLLDASPGGGQEFKVRGGTQAIPMAAAQGVDVRFNTTVVGIRAAGAGGEVVVQALDGRRFVARRVVVAIPPHLAAGIWYSPPLPPKKAKLLATMTQGHLIKVVVTYQTPFWRRKGFSGEVVSSTYPLSICYDDTTPGGRAALVCFVGGGAAVRQSPLAPAERRAQVVSALVRYFGEEARAVDEYLERDWGTEPFTGGCPAGSLNAGGITQWGTALREAHGPVHFGGTETATWWYGFMNGAVQAGERVAMEVMEAFGLPVPEEMRAFYAMGGDAGPSAAVPGAAGPGAAPGAALGAAPGALRERLQVV